MPSLRLVRSRVLPAGTATFERTIVAQNFLLAEAADAPLEPEKVQVVARLKRSTAAVGSGAGAADARLATSARARVEERKCTLTEGREAKDR